ncbi:MAG: M28 family peptidase [Clostridia bacterium]|nr:M28 family peptidase [Clostridia bacterium]
MKKIIAALLAASFLILGCSCSSNPLKEDAKYAMDNKDKLVDRALEYVDYIGTNLTDRNSSSSDGDHDKAVDFIISELKKAGYEDSQINDDVIKGNIRNIVLTVEGKDHSKELIVGAHYDGDGVGDNGSGLALLLATAVDLEGTELPYDVKYVFFDGEEEGMLGSSEFARGLSKEECAKVIYMVNIDSIAFGDYCCVYGGETKGNGEVEGTWAYELTCEKAKALGFEVYGPDDLDGYYKEHHTGPEIKTGAIYTSPWTKKNPAPAEFFRAFSPSTIPASDHVPFLDQGIDYVYFEATNWFAGKGVYAYSGYYETYDMSLGEDGMFMNTSHDTLDNLNGLFPGRMREHFEVYCPLLELIILNPLNE